MIHTSYLYYHPILSELRFSFVIDKSFIILTYSIQKMVGVNMNHFDAQSHVHIQNKIENSVYSGFTVLKQIKMDNFMD